MLIFLTTCLKKYPSNFSLYGQIKMTTKGPFMVEFFVIVGSIDYDCTQWLKIGNLMAIVCGMCVTTT
jgi:hypothetical protein